MRLALALCLSLIPAMAPAQSRFAPEEAAILQSGLSVTADDVILPAYETLAQATAGLRDALAGYCAGAGDRGAVEAAYADAFLAWQGASIVQVGPVMEAEGPMRFQLWPDPKDFSRRAIRAALAAEDPALLEEGGLRGRSIALSNLTALEDLVHDDLAAGTYACDLAESIAAHQAALAREVAAGWRPGAAFRADWDGAAAGNDTFPSVDAAMRELLAGLVVHADRIRKFKLLRGLGASAGDTHPKRTEAVASGLGLPSLQESFAATARMLEAPYGVFDVSPDLGGSMDYLTLGQAAGGTAAALALETRTLDEIAAEDGAAAAELRRQAEMMLNQEAYFKFGYPGSIGLTAGFTSADGD